MGRQYESECGARRQPETGPGLHFTALCHVYEQFACELIEPQGTFSADHDFPRLLMATSGPTRLP